MKKTIKRLFREHFSKQECPSLKVTQEMVDFISKFDSDEELLRSGGLPIDILDRAAHGFAEEDIKQIDPNHLKVRWFDDLENVKWEVDKKGVTPIEYSKKIDLTEPIDVDYWEDLENGFERGFYIQDGHHRYYAASTLKKRLNVNLEIKINPIKELGGDLDYDSYHRCLFKQIKNN